MSLRVGVIGAGGMGREHIANLSAVAGVEIAVVADVVADAAVAAAATVGADVSVDAVGVAARDDLDALVIASPDDTHAELALAAIAAGTPTLCEKPLAATVPDAERVVAAEAATGRSLVQLGFMRPYDAAHVQVRDAVAELGELLHIRSAHRNTNHAWQRSLDVVCTQSLIHDVHTARWMSGAEFVSVVTQVVRSVERIEHVVVLGAMDDGSTVTMEFVEATYGYDIDLEVSSRHGVVSIAQPPQPTVRRDGAGHVHIGDDWFGRFRDAYRVEIETWVAGVRNDVVDGPTTHDGLAAQRVVAAALRSAETGQREQV